MGAEGEEPGAAAPDAAVGELGHIRLAALLVIAVALWVIAGRLDVAVHALLSEQAATGMWRSDGLPHPWIWWVVVLAAIGVSAYLTAAVISRGALHGLGGALAWFAGLAALSIVVFAVWAGWDLVCVHDHGAHRPGGFHAALPAVMAIAVVGLGLATGALYGVTLGEVRRLASVVRVHFFLLGLLIVMAFIFPMTSGQAIDAMRAWTDAGGRLPAAALASALVLGEMMRESGLRLSVAGATGPTLTAGQFRVFRLVTAMPTGILFVGAVIAATDSLLLESIHDQQVRDAVIAAVILGLVTILLVWSVTANSPDAAPPPRPRPPAARAVACVIMLAGAGVGILLATYTQVTAILVILLALAWIAYQWSTGRLDAPSWMAHPLYLGGGIAVGVGFAVYWSPIHDPQELGFIAVALLFTAGLLGVLHLLEVIAGAAARAAGLSFKIPIVLPLVVWFVVAAHYAPQSQHQARVVRVDGLGAPKPLPAATRRWLTAENRFLAATGAKPQYLPLLLVADSGGGSKSAYWTDLVLDCIVSGGKMQRASEPHRECRRPQNSSFPAGLVQRRQRGVFLTSSVSGGSVGVSRYVLNLPSVADGTDWVDGATGRDFLAPTVAWGLYHDLPDTVFGGIGSLVGIDPSDPTECETGQGASCRYNLDRAAIQENTIANRRWDTAPDAADSVDKLWARSLRATSADHVSPLTVFNTAVSGGKGRVLVSPVDLAPLTVLNDECPALRQKRGEPIVDAIDSADLYTKSPNLDTRFDLDITTAGLLSGRFPVVDPVGRLGNSENVVRNSRTADGSGPCLDGAVNTLPAQFVRDGGYVENSGLLTIMQAMRTIRAAATRWHRARGGRPPVVVWVLSIDDDAAYINGNVQPGVARPGPTSLTTKASDETLTELSLESLTLHQGGLACYGRISPAPGVGAHAATGWLLSKTVRTYDLAASLTSSAGLRVPLLSDVRRFLDGRQSGAKGCPIPMR